MKLFAIATLSLIIQKVSGFQAPTPHLSTAPCKPSLAPFSLQQPCSTTRIQFPLQMADNDTTSDETEEGNEDTSSTVSPEKIAGRKKRVIAGYKLMTVGYSLYSALLLVMARAPLYNVSGPLFQAGISYIMIGAAENNRLASDTYKRLNLALIGYGAITFGTEIGLTLGPLWLITNLIAIINSVKGYGYGLKGWELGDASAKDDILNGVKSNFECMKNIPNLKSAGYAMATATLELLKLQKLFEILSSAGKSSFFIGTRLIHLARLMVMTIALFTLKDAADRDRLEGTTFIELNFLASLSLGSWAACGDFSKPLRGIFALFSGLSVFNGVLSVRKKQSEGD